MKHIRPVVILATLGWLWFGSGYLLYSYATSSILVAYGIFPVIYFGFRDCAKDGLTMLGVITLLGGAWYGIGYLLVSVFGFRPLLSYGFVPLIFIVVLLLVSIIFPVSNNIGEDNYGDEEDKTS